jgi:two-component system chemotaxis response regulator CheY
MMEKKTVLLVEDSAEIQMLMTKFLMQNGYVVERANNGAAALRLLSELPQAPDLIVLDLMMPEMDGYQFREVQSRDSNISSIPIVIMTADRDVEKKAKQLNASGFLKKPFKDLDTILSVVSDAINW